MLRRAAAGARVDPNGTLLGHRGGLGAGRRVSTSNHYITVDEKVNVWIWGDGGEAGHAGAEFSRAGKFPAVEGKANAGGEGDGRTGEADLCLEAAMYPTPGRVAKIFADPSAKEADRAMATKKSVAIVDADRGS